MNFKLPFETMPGYLPVIMATILCIIAVFLSVWLLNINKEKVEARKRARKLSRKQRQKIRHETRKLKKQERKLK